MHCVLHTLVRLGETERAEQALADLGEHERDRGEMRIAAAALRLAQDDPRAATAALAPVLDGSAPAGRPAWLVQAFLLEAIARDALGDPAAAGRALERALDLAEPDGVLLPFLLHPAPGLLERHARHRTAHAALIARDPRTCWPASRPAAARRAAAAARAAERQRDPGAALPADQPVRAGDRQRAVGLGQHRQDTHAPPVRQARRAPPAPRPWSAPALWWPGGALLEQAMTQGVCTAAAPACLESCAVLAGSTGAAGITKIR